MTFTYSCGANGKDPLANAGDIRDTGLIPGSGRSPGGGQPTPAFLPGESYGLYSPWGSKESDMTEQLSLTKVINREYSLEGLVLKLEFQYFGNLMQRADSL